MKQIIAFLVLLSVMSTVNAQQHDETHSRLPFTYNQSAGIGISMSRLYSDFGLNQQPGGKMPLVVPELEFNVWLAYISIGAWRHSVGSPFPGVEEKIGTALWKVGPMFRLGNVGHCWTFTPYIGGLGSWTSWDDEATAETFGAENRKGNRFIAGLRVGLTRKNFECAVHASNRECGLSVMLKIDFDE